MYLPPEGVGHVAVISVKVPYPNFAKKVAHALWATKHGTYLFYVIVVDDDVDITNMDEVIHAISVKCHPYRGVSKFKDAPAYPFLLPLSRYLCDIQISKGIRRSKWNLKQTSQKL